MLDDIFSDEQGVFNLESALTNQALENKAFYHLVAPAGPSPTVHPIQSPQNRFCVLTLDPETLPAIATTLIDVLFYSHRWAPWHW